MNPNILSELYKQHVGSEPQNIEELPASGSNRRYFRLSGEQSIIGVLGECKEENEAFLYMDRHFHDKGLNVPKVLAQVPDSMAYIQEDLGDLSLFKAIEKGRQTRVFSDDEKQLLIKTIRQLCQFQFAGADGMDFYRRISDESIRILRPGGILLLELGYGEADAVSALLASAGFTGISVKKDFRGIARMMLAVSPARRNYV